MKSTEIGPRIRELRKARELSQAKLAGRSDVDPNQLARVERGESEPSVAWLEKVAEGLGVGFLVEFVDVSRSTGRTRDAAAGGLRLVESASDAESDGLSPLWVEAPEWWRSARDRSYEEHGRPSAKTDAVLATVWHAHGGAKYKGEEIDQAFASARASATRGASKKPRAADAPPGALKSTRKGAGPQKR